LLRFARRFRGSKRNCISKQIHGPHSMSHSILSRGAVQFLGLERAPFDASCSHTLAAVAAVRGWTGTAWHTAATMKIAGYKPRPNEAPVSVAALQIAPQDGSQAPPSGRHHVMFSVWHTEQLELDTSSS
jgi:hypothetical protein